MDYQWDSVTVRLPDRSYSVRIGAGCLDHVGGLLHDLARFDRATIVTDTIVGPLHGRRLEDSLRAAGIEVQWVRITAGEGSKSLATVAQVYDQLAEWRHGRDDPVVALGGGVVTDLAGFVAATWHRGVPSILCPTTSEACIDAAIGGKTGVNHPAGKNLIGAFHQPRLVVVDVDCLKTLPQREFVSGLAESIKHAVVADPSFLPWQLESADAILRREPAVLCRLISRNCAIKAAIVEQDEREHDGHAIGRAALNFGHTLGHAIEAQCGFQLRHGEAVALGMVAESILANRLLGLPHADASSIRAALATFELPVVSPVPLDSDDLIRRLTLDKKVRSRQVRLALPRNLGVIEWVFDPPRVELQRAIDAICAAPSKL